MNLFVAGLPYDVDDQELQQIFEEYGTVGSAKVILDKETRKSRGFGFVEMDNNQEAQEAIERFNGHELQGRPLTVNEAKPKESRPGGGRSFSGPGDGGRRGNRTGGGGYGRRP